MLYSAHPLRVSIIGDKVVMKCSAMLQKELVDKLVDEACGNEVKEGHAGLCEYVSSLAPRPESNEKCVLCCCRKHYKEYLVDKINKAKLDPISLYENIGVILIREEKPVPEKEEDEEDDHYTQRLIEVLVCECSTIYIISVAISFLACEEGTSSDKRAARCRCATCS